MIDTNTARLDENGLDDESDAGIRRPDHGGTNQLGQTAEGPARGLGSNGFGSGA